VKPPPFLYLRPEGLDEAVARLAELADDAKVLAGGQSLVPLMNLRLARPSVLVDLRAVPGLAGIDHVDGWLSIGAMVRQRTAELSPVVGDECPLVAQALRHVGHLQTRNQGTIGGSMAHGDPSAELPAVAVAVDAALVARSVRGERAIPAGAFFEGPFTTALAADEVLTEIRVPPQAGSRTAFAEVARRSGDFALAGVASRVRLDEGGTATEVALVAIAVGGTPVRLRAAEDELLGGPLDDRAVAAASRAATADVDPYDDVQASGAYRRTLVGVLVDRSLRKVRG
jgi:aerobic carbon-monoxide dehydrogenase medium subunit